MSGYVPSAQYDDAIYDARLLDAIRAHVRRTREPAHTSDVATAAHMTQARAASRLHVLARHGRVRVVRVGRANHYEVA